MPRVPIARSGAILLRVLEGEVARPDECGFRPSWLPVPLAQFGHSERHQFFADRTCGRRYPVNDEILVLADSTLRLNVMVVQLLDSKPLLTGPW